MTKCLLDADYFTRNEKPVIRLYYKTEEGDTIEEVDDFLPYFWALARTDIEKLKSDVEKIDQVERSEVLERTYHSTKVQALKITLKHPSQVRDIRQAVGMLPECQMYLEADIPFTRRYIIDSGIVPMEGVEKISLNIAAVDIEISCEGQPDSSNTPVHMISYADSKGLSRVWYWGRDDACFDWAIACTDEKQMLQRFLDTLKSQEINIITGYNTDNFDFPYLQERAQKNRMELKIGVGGLELRMERRGMNNGARIVGRPHIDMYPVCRAVFNLPRYQLEDVYEFLFKEKKIDIEVKQIREFYESKDPREFEKLCSYSKADADSTLKISQKMLPLMYELSKVVRQPIYESSRMSSGQRVESFLIDQTYQRGALVPNRPSDEQYLDRDKGKFEGAFVVDPVKGIHDNILLFDFRSLYPSIIISHNIDTDTLDCQCCAQTAEKTPNNHHFCLINRGFIPEVLQKLIDKRIQIKAQMKKTVDEDKLALYDVEQQAMKLLANSMYGYYGFQRARWYSRDCASEITSLGRQYIKKTISHAQKMGFEVVYGDTDSVYLTQPEEQDVEKIITHAKEFQKQINQKLPDAMDLEFEGYYPRGVFITKKRYALIDEKGKLTIKGLETRRRDWCTLAKDTQQKVLDAVLKDRDPEKAAEMVKKAVEEIRGTKVPLQMLVINTQMTRNLSGYVNEGPHVSAVKKAMLQGMEFKPGDIISYIVTKSGGPNISDRAVHVDFVQPDEYDSDYYINNQLLPAVMRILEALGYQEDEMKGLGRQTSLGDW